MRRLSCARTRFSLTSCASSTACSTAFFVISWKTMRLTGTFGLSTSRQVPADRLAFAVRVGREQHFGGVLQRRLQLRDVLPLVVGNDVVRLEVAVGVDAEPSPLLLLDLFGHSLGRLGQVADVAEARLARVYRSPRKRSSVRALAGDSTMTSVFAIVPLHPSTFCQSERTGRRRRAAPAPAVPARTAAAADAASSRPGSLGNLVEIARLRPASEQRENRVAGSAGSPLAPHVDAAAARGASPSSSRISSADSTIFAPSRSSACAPRLRPLRTLPGTASTSRPCSSAQRAVMSDPLFSPASTTTTARDRPLMMRLRSGKNCGSGGVPGTQLADDGAALRRCRRASDAARADTSTSTPDPRTRDRRRRRPTSAPRCAAESTPRASPLTIDEAARREIAGEPLGDRQAVRRRRARADDRDRGRARAPRRARASRAPAADRRSSASATGYAASLHGDRRDAARRGARDRRRARAMQRRAVSGRPAVSRRRAARRATAAGGSPARSRSAAIAPAPRTAAATARRRSRVGHGRTSTGATATTKKEAGAAAPNARGPTSCTSL